MHTKQTSLVLVVLLGATYANSARSDEKRRIGEAGRGGPPPGEVGAR